MTVCTLAHRSHESKSCRVIKVGVKSQLSGSWAFNIQILTDCPLMISWCLCPRPSIFLSLQFRYCFPRHSDGACTVAGFEIWQWTSRQIHTALPINQLLQREYRSIFFFREHICLNFSYNTRITIPMTIFIVLSSWRGHCESSPGSFDKCRLSARWPPTIRPSQSTWPRSLLLSTSTITIYYYYWVWKADTHFTISRRVEGWVELGTVVRMYIVCTSYAQKWQGYPTSRIAVIRWRM